ncbi:kinase [Actinophytocola sp.]|uniref:GHMP family kinase ATP-binding protein n=1 Tax=Actinophytocola sp. TaxID=1872138 RepID=UPI00389B191F
MTDLVVTARGDLRHGAGISFGTFGELLQGALPGPDQDFLVTLPIVRWSTARLTLLPDADELRVEPAHKHKSLRIARSVLACHGVAPGGRLLVTSQLPEGKGMASSSADLVATIRATGKAIGRRITPRTAEAFLRTIEPTDGLMYRDVVAFYHRRVELYRCLAAPPPLTIVGVDEGGQVDTVSFNATRTPITTGERREYARLLDLLAVALACGDLATVGRVATRSAELNQARCPKRYLDRLRELCRQVGGLGVVVAHSGTVLGILISNDDPDHAGKLADATTACHELAGNVSVDYTADPVSVLRRARISVG